MMITCEYCRQEFTRESDLKRHAGYCKKQGEASHREKCASCEKTFARRDILTRHLKTCRGSKRSSSVSDGPQRKKIRCDVCEANVISMPAHLQSAAHKNKSCETAVGDEYVQIISTSYKNRVATYRVFALKEFLTPSEFLDSVKERSVELIRCKRAEVGCEVKVNLELFALYIKWREVEGEKQQSELEEVKSFNTRNKVIHSDDSDMGAVYETFREKIIAKADEFQERDSGWALKSILYLEININKYQPLRGTSYLPLPTWIQRKHACINVKNADDACFAWAVVSALYPAQKHSERLSSYPNYCDVLNLQKISFPMTLEGIKRFEEQNNLSINVFEINEKTIGGPIYHTKQRRTPHINLLLIEDGEQTHYCWIKNLSRLVRSQITMYEHRAWLCDGCLLSFTDHNKFNQHIQRDCSHVLTILPNEQNKILKFTNFRNRMRAPVVVYADFEALLQPISGCDPNNLSSYTRDYQRHVPYSFGYYIKCAYDDSLSKYVTYRGEECVKQFLTSLEVELTPFAEAMRQVKPMSPLTLEQLNAFHACINCHICGEKLGDDRVRDHDHLSGEFRGAAHNKCNLNFKIKPVFPIFIHNLSGYDSHFIIEKLQGCDVNIIPKNKENFISITSVKHGSLKFDLRFVDSYRFLAVGLDKLAANLEPHQFTETKAHCASENVELMVRKGVFPYDYVSCWERLAETSLPPQDDFYSKLTKSHISESDYQHAQKVWEKFNIKTLGEYSDLYLKTDVLLLADIFENFRYICLRTYKLDPAHYYTAPGLSFDSMMCSTKVELELLTDYEMVKFISGGIRGGLSQCCCKYAKANNKYLDDYNSNKPSNYIVYLDANNQYGWAMSQPMPLKDFRWLSMEEIERFNVMDISPDAATGYILEVDLDYPAHLHDLHNDFCFCPENRIPDLSSAKTPKLLSTLHSKEHYVIHYLNLKQALDAGLELKGVHRILSFAQSPWLKKYIDLNTAQRMSAKNSFEKDFFKLMNNAVFGKTMENVEKRVDVRLVNRWESVGKRLGARALISRLNFHSITVIDDELSIIQMKRNRIKYDKPIYAGFAVLELSKTLMFDFHYNYIKPKYGSNVKLLYTDTDSFIYDIKTKDFYNDILPELEQRFDTSDFAPDNIQRLPLVNKKVVGKFKDECSGVMIKEFIGVRSKCYFIERVKGDTIKKIKGIKRNVVCNEVSREDFFRCVNEKGSLQHRAMHVIRSKEHTLYSQTLNKITLNNFDDKRFATPDTLYETLAWGHKSIDKKYYFI